jgi:hypothetical protein
LKLLEQKGAQQPLIPLPRRGVLLDTCACSTVVPISQSGTCLSCGKSRVRELPPYVSHTPFPKKEQNKTTQKSQFLLLFFSVPILFQEECLLVYRIDKGAQGFGMPWGPDQVKSEVCGSLFYYFYLFVLLRFLLYAPYILFFSFLLFPRHFHYN